MNFTKEEMIAIATRISSSHALDPALVCAIIEQESGWEPFAIRYEPGFFEHYVYPLNLRNATEAHARAMSWGLMQIMGQSAREIGYPGHLATLCDPETGITWGCELFTHKVSSAKGDVNKALSLWNGGGNAAYLGQVVARMSKYK